MADLNVDNAPSGQDAALSKTIVGLLIAIIAPLVARYGIDDGAMQAIGQALGVIVGGALTVWGRQTARAPITHVAGVELPQVMVPKSEDSKS